MLKQDLNDQIIDLRRRSAEYYQKAAWNQLLALDHYREKNFAAAERFAQLSFEDQMTAMEYAELADAEATLVIEMKFSENYSLVRNNYDECY
jgi:hypothetical protein